MDDGAGHQKVALPALPVGTQSHKAPAVGRAERSSAIERERGVGKRQQAPIDGLHQQGIYRGGLASHMREPPEVTNSLDRVPGRREGVAGQDLKSVAALPVRHQLADRDLAWVQDGKVQSAVAPAAVEPAAAQGQCGKLPVVLRQQMFGLGGEEVMGVKGGLSSRCWGQCF